MTMPRLLRYIFVTSILVCVLIPMMHVVRNWPMDKFNCVYTQPSLQGTSSKTVTVLEEGKRNVQGVKVLKKGVSYSQRNCVSKILILGQLKRGRISKTLLSILQAQRIAYDAYSMPFAKGTVPDLVQGEKTRGKYCIILVLDMFQYVTDGSMHQLFEEYCAKFGASLIFMVQESNQIYYKDLKLYSLPESTSLLRVHEADNFKYAKNGGLWRWNKENGLLVSAHFTKDIVFAVPSAYKPLDNDRFQFLVSIELNTSHHLPISFIDWKSSDNITKGYIGMSLSIPLTKLVLLEILQLLNRDILKFNNQRWIQIDIDDVFVAPEGFKPTAADVKAMSAAKKSLQQYVTGFTFNLGFCGYYYGHGSSLEVEGDQELITIAKEFNWFPHIFNHKQPHLLSSDQLQTLMQSNKEFASKHDIPIVNHYSVSPHHSGVYPVYEPLYSLWKSMYNITVTSTEEYPHLKPDHLRRGFIHNGVKVLPRQTCRLFTHINDFSDFAGGREGLLSVAEGGELFNTILNNPISIFMTHTSNYARDRLAPFLFETAFKFIKQWTNLELLAEEPIKLADRYFNLFPEDRAPLWTNPCKDKRHMSIWHMANCSKLPSVIIVGPQKTGTTALLTFLKLHPQLVANDPTELFEEVQFFSNEHLYDQGIEWYMSAFPSTHTSSVMLFEKSATYFTHSLAPSRIRALLPNVKLVAVLIDPGKRAYSWYQHTRAHNDHTSLSHNFTAVLRASDPKKFSRKLVSLREHCLSPGKYHQHLVRWFKKFPSDQIYIVDGEKLSVNPEPVLSDLTSSLKLRPFDFSARLRYNSKKKFYCVLNSDNKEECLGKGKGREYPHMSPEDAKYLTQYYSSHNRKLYQLLLHYSKTPPSWLLS